MPQSEGRVNGRSGRNGRSRGVCASCGAHTHTRRWSAISQGGARVVAQLCHACEHWVHWAIREPIRIGTVKPLWMVQREG